MASASATTQQTRNSHGLPHTILTVNQCYGGSKSIHHPHTTKSKHNITIAAKHQRSYSKTHPSTRPPDWRRPTH
eukprot:3734543-Rhodomonas_salina.1